MENKNQEVVELQVKPNKYSQLEITNNVREWLYQALDNPYYQAYLVSRSWDLLDLDFRYKGGWSYESDAEKNLWLDAKLVWDPSTEFSERWVDVNWNTEKREVTGQSARVYWRDFQSFKLTDMDGIIELSNWKFLINKYGKYEPNLSFLTSVPAIKYERVSSRDLNFARWDFSVLYGEFFISKKWTKCFRILPKEKAKHILIRDDWWWPFNDYRWRTLPEEGAVYYRRASSNWWWSGYDYGIYNKNFRNAVSEEDI